MEEKFQNKSTLKLIIMMSLPPILSMMMQSLYSIVDAWYVAKVSEEAFNAVSMVFPIQSIILSIAVGLGIAVNGAIARSLGRKDEEKSKEYIILGTILTVIHYILIFLLSFIVLDPFISANITNEATAIMAKSYINIITIFSFGLLFQLTFEKILQGHGNMLVPTIVQIIGCLLNIILDHIFVLVLNYGVTGAACATVISQIFSGTTLCLYVLIHKRYTISFKYLKFSKENLLEIYKVCLPSTIMMSLPSVLIMGLNSMLQSIHEVYVNVLNLYLKVQTFIFMPIMGLSQGIRPIIGYFYGAKEGKKIKEVLINSIILITTVMIIGVILFNIIPETLIKIFFDNTDIIAYGTTAFKIISISFIFVGVSFLLNTFYDSIGLGYVSLIINISRQFIITLILSALCVYVFKTGASGVWVSIVIAEVFTAIMGIFMFRYTYKNTEILI